MKFEHLLLNDTYFGTAHDLARNSRSAWLCSCGLQEGWGVRTLMALLPEARVLIGAPDAEDTTRDLERTRNSVRYFARVWPKHQFRESYLTHFKFHVFFLKTPKPSCAAFIGSMNLTSNRWDELMLLVSDPVAEELKLLFEHLWKNAKEVKPHPKTFIKDLESRIVRGRFNVE